MILKKNFTLLVFIIGIRLFYGQNEDAINTDRPDQSDGAYILAVKNIQIENGFRLDTISLINNLMIRQGVSKGTEIRVLCDFGKTRKTTGVYPVIFGVKQKVFKPKSNKLIPAITLSGYYSFGRLAGKQFASNKDTYSLIIVLQHDWSENFSFGYNIGSTDFKDHYNFTTFACFSPLPRITFFLEYFAFFERNNLPVNNTDFGILFLVKNNFQIDFAANLPIANNQFIPYLTAGFSWRSKW